MKKTSILHLFVFSILAVFSQETVSSAGEQLNGSQAKINFTIGEPVIYELSTGTHRVLNGYQQPMLKIDTVDGIHETLNWEVSIYPNPSQDIVNIDWDRSELQELNYQLYSIEGKLIIEGKSKDPINLDISQISSGNYFLYLKEKNQQQTYKIEKIK